MSNHNVVGIKVWRRPRSDRHHRSASNTLSGRLPIGKGSFGLLVGCLGFSAFIPNALAFTNELKAETLQLYRVGQSDYAAGRFEQSAQKFCLGLKSVPLPVLALWCARAQAHSGALVAALETYELATHLSPNELWFGDKQQRAQVVAATEHEELRTRVPRLKVLLMRKESGIIEVLLDGRVLAPSAIGTEQLLNPGKHLVELRAAMNTTVRRVELHEYESQVVVLETRSLDAGVPLDVQEAKYPSSSAAEGRPPLKRTLGWVGVAAGAAGLVVGAVTGLMVYHRHDEISGDCVDGICNPRRVTASQIDAYNRLRLTSSIGLIAGGAMGAAGFALIVFSPSQEALRRVSIGVHASGVVASGVF